METTLTVSYTTKSGHVKHVTVGRGKLLAALNRIMGQGGTINNIT